MSSITLLDPNQHSYILGGKGKWDILNGTIPQPSVDNPSYNKWEAEKSTIMSWLLHSIQPKLSQGYLFLSAAKEILDVVA